MGPNRRPTTTWEFCPEAGIVLKSLNFLPSVFPTQPSFSSTLGYLNYKRYKLFAWSWGLQSLSEIYIYIYISFSPSPHLFKALQRIFKRMLCKNPSELPCFSNLHLQPILLILNTNNCLHRHWNFLFHNCPGFIYLHFSVSVVLGSNQSHCK